MAQEIPRVFPTLIAFSSLSLKLDDDALKTFLCDLWITMLIIKIYPAMQRASQYKK